MQPMKTLLTLPFFILLSLYSNAQVDKVVEVGDYMTRFRAFELLKADNDTIAESTYYTIRDGVLEYHYINIYEGSVLQYKLLYANVSDLDTKSVEYKSYDGTAVFMHISTKGLEPNVMNMSADDNNGKASKMEDTDRSMMLIIPDEATGEKILKEIKKGKDL